MNVITFSNKPNSPGESNLISTLENTRYSYQIIGRGLKWTNFMTKIQGYLDYLKNVTEINNIYLIIDCFDMFALGSPTEILQKYSKYFPKIVVGSETFCGGCCIPLNNFSHLEVSRFCNSGFILGPREKLINCLEQLLILDSTNDQVALCKYINLYPEEFHLDTKSEFVANLLGIDFNRFRWDKSNNRVLNLDSGEKACFVHIPGIDGDLGYRYAYFGKCILGDRFQNNNRIFPLLKRYKWILFLIIVMGIYKKIPGISILSLCIIGWIWYKFQWN
jgi:hypothetical protein